MTIPIIIKLLSSLVLIIILNRVTKRLPLALLGGAIFFAVWIGLGPLGILEVAGTSLFNWNTLGLVALVSSVILLSMQMSETGMVQELVASIRSAFSPRASLAVIPAVIGLLPMPGGALFSAPLLDNFDDLQGINPNTKTSINYWFRHVWEFAWPLYPGVIVACDIAGIELWQMLVYGLPLSFVSIVAGYFFFLKQIGTSHAESVKAHTFSLVPFLPVLTVIVLYGLLQFLAPTLGDFNQYLPMVIGLFASLIVLQVLRPLTVETWVKMLISPRIFKMLLIILMVRVYGAFIATEINGVSVVQSMANEMQHFGIPSLPLIMALPFLTGMTMGVAVGFAGTAMPVVVALMGPDPNFGVLIGTVIFAYVSGFMGTMLSPLHVCMIVTSEYYKTDLIRSYRPMVVPAVFMILVAFGYMQVLSIIV